MKINLVSVEDGIDNIGFRKLSAFVKRLYPETKVHYVTTGNLRSLTRVISMKGAAPLFTVDTETIALSVAAADIVGFSSKKHYPRILLLLRSLYLIKRAIDHFRFLDFTVITGRFGYLLWKAGVIGWWRRRLQRLQRGV